LRYETSTLQFTDGFKSADGTGLGVYVPGVQQVGYCLHEPSSVFTAEISALLDALLFIKYIYLGEYLILSDSLSLIGALRSQRTSAGPILYIRVHGRLWWLRSRQFKFRLMWIPARKLKKASDSLNQDYLGILFNKFFLISD
jgi:hypothetical protein